MDRGSWWAIVHIFYAPLSISSYIYTYMYKYMNIFSYFHHKTKKNQISKPEQILNTENEDIVSPEGVILLFFFFLREASCTNLRPLLFRTECQSTVSILINSIPSALRKPCNLSLRLLFTSVLLHC